MQYAHVCTDVLYRCHTPVFTCQVLFDTILTHSPTLTPFRLAAPPLRRCQAMTWYTGAVWSSPNHPRSHRPPSPPTPLPAPAAHST